MFCRIALVVLVACLIIYPVQTVGLVTDGWWKLMEIGASLGSTAAQEFIDMGQQIYDDRLQHREMQ